MKIESKAATHRACKGK